MSPQSREVRRMPTLSDVAERAGVSKSTASRVLSDSVTFVEPETAGLVRQAAWELGYVPNPHARALARATSPSIGLLIHEVANPFFSEIASGVLAAAERHDRMVMICNTRRDPDQELRFVREMTAMRVHAIVVAGSAFHDPEYSEVLDKELSAFRETGGQVVLMRRSPAGSIVVPDVSKGARLVADHLVSLGHTHIGVISGPPSLETIYERRTAFQEWLRSHGIEIAAIQPGDFTREGGRQGAERMLNDDPKITAIFALNDLMAVGAIHAAHHLGLEVPQDISVVGFNDIPVALDTNPPLTTLRLPLREWGEAALEVAMADDSAESRTVVLDVEMVVRASTGPARGEGTRFLASGTSE